MAVVYIVGRDQEKGGGGDRIWLKVLRLGRIINDCCREGTRRKGGRQNMPISDWSGENHV